MANVRSLADMRREEEGAAGNGGGAGGLPQPPPGDAGAPGRPGNEYYAGGNTGGGGGSGLAVVGPGGGGGAGGGAGGEGRSMEDDIVESARRHMAEGGGAEDVGDDEGAVTITLWRNGFTVNDGPLRDREAPESQQFLEDLNRGRVPRELEQAGRDMNVRLVDKRSADYVEKFRAFAGAGQTMGGGEAKAEAVVGGEASEGAIESFEVDTNAPTTVVQIRLHNGKRLRETFNTTHTLRHVQAVIHREGAGGSAYVLMGGFPPQQLTDFDATLEAAGLKGANITQKLS